MLLTYRSLFDVWSSSQAITFSLDHPAAVWGLVKSLPAWPNNSERMINGETGASASGDWLRKSSGERSINADNALNCLNDRPKAVKSPAIGCSAVSKCWQSDFKRFRPDCEMGRMIAKFRTNNSMQRSANSLPHTSVICLSENGTMWRVQARCRKSRNSFM